MSNTQAVPKVPADVGCIGAVVGSGFVIALLSWASAWTIALATGVDRPGLDAAAVLVLVTGGYPGIPLRTHLIVMAVLLAFVLACVVIVVHRVRRRSASIAGRIRAFEQRAGWARPAQVAATMSKAQLMRQAGVLRPSLPSPSPADVGFLLGRYKRLQVWASVERNLLAIGPTRSGKGRFLVINGILDAPGPVVTTSTRPENLRLTWQLREQSGPVGVFDPQGMLGAFDGQVAWDLVAGCEEPARAGTRAAALVNQSGISETSENAAWRNFAKTAIECCLHAAAVKRAATGDIDSTTIREVYRWMQGRGNGLEEPAAILRQYADHSGCRNPDLPHEPVACQWAGRLDGIYQGDARFVTSVMSVVQNSMAPLGYPSVMAALSPSTTRPAFTAEQLLAGSGTIYALATDKGSVPAAAFVSALIEDIAYAARITAARRDGRLDPPLHFELDECANVAATIPSLPMLLSDGSGQGMTIRTYFQSLSQIRSAYGRDDAATIFATSQVKVVLGGSDDSGDNRDLATLVGEVDEVVHSSSRSADAMFAEKGASVSTSLRKESILPASAIRQIPFGAALCLVSQTPPFPLRMTEQDFLKRPDYSLMQASNAELGRRINAAIGQAT